MSFEYLDQLTGRSRCGTLTVSATSSAVAAKVTVNESNASLYQNGTFALGDFTVANGANTFTAIAQDSYGLRSTNSLTTPEGRCA